MARDMSPEALARRQANRAPGFQQARQAIRTQRLQQVVQKGGGGLSSEPDYIEDYTIYELDFANLASGATANQVIQIQADSIFKWTKGTYYCDIGGAVFTDSTRPIPQVRIQIQDTGSGRVLFNNPVPIANIFGNGQLPFILPVERVFAPRASIQVTAINFSAASTYNIGLSFIGSKIFDY